MPFDLQPTLIGTLLELRPLREQDWPELFAVASDPLIWELHPQWDRYKEEVFQEFFRGAIASGGAFAVIDRSDARIIGSTRFHGLNEEKSEIEIGWTFLARSHWGGVFNREMKYLMMRYAFQFVDRICFFIGTENFRSQRAIEKLGGVRIGQCVNELGGENFVYEIMKKALM